MNKLIGLNQYHKLREILNDKFYAEHFKIYDTENTEKLRNMTDKQYRYLVYLMSNKKWFDIKKLLDKFLTHK